MTYIIIGAVVLVLLLAFFYCNNKELALRKEAEAQEKKIESVHDAMWKIIQQKASVSNEYKEAFEKIYHDLISGRYANDNGNLMKWIQEQNPNFDTSLYKDLMQAIEVQRLRFDSAQQRMVDIIRERESFIQSIPACFLVMNKKVIEYEIISSTRTKEVMQTRVDDDVNLFEKK